MKTIKAYKSPYTGELFESLKEYENHVNDHKALKQIEEKKKQLLRDKDILMNEVRLNLTSIHDFPEQLMKVVTKLNEGNPDQLLFVDFSRLWFGDVSNSHSSPIDGVSNFRRKDDLPKFYKGWNGKVTFVYSSSKNTGKNRDKLERLTKNFPGINTGSGGYRGREYKGFNGYVLSCGLRLYLSDFPILKERYSEYLKLKEEKSKWKLENDSNISELYSKDLEILKGEKEVNKIDEKINELLKRKNEITSFQNECFRELKDHIYDCNPFKNNTDFSDLENEFNEL